MTETTPIYTAVATGHDYEHEGYGWHHHKKRFSWQPIVAGIAAALAVQVVLGLIGTGLGLGVGITMPGLPWQETPGIGTLMWAGASILTSAFYGGFIAARLTKSTCHHEGVLSGIVAWAGSVLVVLYLISSAYGGLFGGASQIMGHFAGPHFGPQFGYQRFATMPHPTLQTPGAPLTADALNHQELNTSIMTSVAPTEQEKAAHEKAALAAGVTLLLAAFVSALGGSLGTAHVRHDRERHMLAKKAL